jgi:hypothetical protein
LLNDRAGYFSKTHGLKPYHKPIEQKPPHIVGYDAGGHTPDRAARVKIGLTALFLAPGAAVRSATRQCDRRPIRTRPAKEFQKHLPAGALCHRLRIVRLERSATVEPFGGTQGRRLELLEPLERSGPDCCLLPRAYFGPFQRNY